MDGREYVSRLARRLEISRALLPVHLRKLEASGLVEATLELSAEGKAMKFYTVRQFAIELTPRALAAAAATLTFEEARPGRRAGVIGRMELAVNDYALIEDFGYAAVLLLFGVLLVWTARYVLLADQDGDKEKEFRELAEKSTAGAWRPAPQVESLQTDVAPTCDAGCRRWRSC